jgi:phosphohistidine phosphatase
VALSRVLIMRHAESEDGPELDPTRTLTETGRTVQIPAIADFLVRQLGRVDLVVSSNMARARDTAKPLFEALGATGFEEIWQLDPDIKPEVAWKRIKQLGQNCESALVVTHQPLVSELLKYLCGAQTGEKTFPHAAVACIHLHKDMNQIHLAWLVNPLLVERDEIATTREALKLTKELLEALRSDSDETDEVVLSSQV